MPKVIGKNPKLFINGVEVKIAPNSVKFESKGDSTPRRHNADIIPRNCRCDHVEFFGVSLVENPVNPDCRIIETDEVEK